MRAAAEVFAEEGFVSATITSISRKAGVSNGALHFHFENKHNLGQAVEAEFVDTIARIIREADERPGNALQRLIDAAHVLMRSIEDDMVVRAAFQMVNTAPRRERGLDQQGMWHRWIDKMLHTAQREGALAEGVSPTQASIAIVAATVGLAVLGIRDPKWVSRHTLSQFWELMLPQLTPSDRMSELVPRGTDSGRS
jgi:AcrR family transcriptional regulator